MRPSLPRRGAPAALFAALALLLGLLLAYAPALRGGFLWDDDAYIRDNPLLQAPDGLRRIWFSRDAPSQYFPLTYTMFRLERALWGDGTLGYHAVNVLLHWANALLLWRLLRLLSVPGAPLAALLFALHPVQVESVAWMTERKNLLSALFSLLAALAWIGRDRSGTARRRRLRSRLSFGLFLLALFSKSTAVTLPAVLLVVDWYRGRAPGGRRLLALAPFAAAAAAMAGLAIWWERHLQGALGPEVAPPWAERPLIAARGLWHYLGTLLWPSDLSFSYPRWALPAGDLRSWTWAVAVGLSAAALWLLRRRLGRGPAAAAGFFAATLAPILGFVPQSNFLYTYVADHHLYLACVGPLALAAAGVARLLASPGPRRAGGAAFALIVPAVLGLLTWQRAHAFADAETLWRDTLAHNPSSWLARNNLGDLLAASGRTGEAEGEYRASLALRPDFPITRFNLANLLAADEGRSAEAEAEYREALRLAPAYSAAHNNLGTLLARRGDLAQARRHFELAAATRPDNAMAWTNLGRLLLREGDPAGAEAMFERARAFEAGGAGGPALPHRGRRLPER